MRIMVGLAGDDLPGMNWRGGFSFWAGDDAALDAQKDPPGGPGTLGQPCPY